MASFLPPTANNELIQIITEIDALIAQTRWQKTYSFKGFPDPRLRTKAINDYATSFLIALVVRDQNVSRGGVLVMNALMGSTEGNTEAGLRSWILSTSAKANEQVSSLPKFFKLLATHDVENKARSSRVVLNLLQTFRDAVMAGDSTELEWKAQRANQILSPIAQ